MSLAVKRKEMDKKRLEFAMADAEVRIMEREEEIARLRKQMADQQAALDQINKELQDLEGGSK